MNTRLAHVADYCCPSKTQPRQGVQRALALASPCAQKNTDFVESDASIQILGKKSSMKACTFGSRNSRLSTDSLEVVTPFVRSKGVLASLAALPALLHSAKRVKELKGVGLLVGVRGRDNLPVLLLQLLHNLPFEVL